MIKKLVIWMTLITLIPAAVLVAGGCKAAPVTPPEIPPDPFTNVWGLGDKYVVTFSGNSAGHVAGGTSEFILELDNRVADQRWQGEYCVLLLNKDGVVMEIAYQQFDIPAGLKTHMPITVQFPADLDGAYGLSIIIPGRGQSITTIWIGEKRPISVGPWPVFHTCPYYLTEEGSRDLAWELVRSSPTFIFDGIEDSLRLVETLYPDIENAWQFVFQFESRHAGYGDRTNQSLLQVITPHEAVITVEQGEVKSALMDGKWDMINQKMLNS